MLNRRRFVTSVAGSVAALSLGGPLPGVFARAARHGREGGEKVLVVIQLTGGNDGINTLVPFGDDLYYANRFSLAVPKNDVVRLDDWCGLHPALKPMTAMLEADRYSVVQGVGYPQPNRSHFESMDLWHTAHQLTGPQSTGWLGRAATRLEVPGQLPPLHLGGEVQPLALATRGTPATSIRSIDSFRLNFDSDGEIGRLLELSNSLPRRSDNPLLNQVELGVSAATDASRRLSEAGKARDRGVSYPSTGLAGKLRLVADLIAADMPVRIYYVTLDGFDTHANQGPAHASLLAELAGASAAFLADLAAQSQLDRVLLFTFSEFGRRLKENGSLGTDHGAASIVQLAGPRMKASLAGRYPSLTDLDEGDLKFSVDYRSLYSTVLERWLEVDPALVLDQQYPRLDLFA